MIIYELKGGDWSNSIKKDLVRIMYEESCDEVDVQTQEDTTSPQRDRNMTDILQDYVVTQNNVINDEGELEHYTFFADTKPINATEALSNPKWMNVMMEELYSIKFNKTWTLLDLPHVNKEIDVK